MEAFYVKQTERYFRWLHKALRSLISIVNLYHSSLQKSLQERTTLQREFQEDVTSLKKAADTV